MKIVSLLLVLGSFFAVAQSSYAEINILDEDVLLIPSWSCQCFENANSAVPVAENEFESTEQVQTLKQAEKFNLKQCRMKDANVSISRCLKIIRTQSL